MRILSAIDSQTKKIVKKIVKKISDYSGIHAKSAFVCHSTGQKMTFSTSPLSAPSFQ
jgi:hypothetical protein